MTREEAMLYLNSFRQQTMYEKPQRSVNKQIPFKKKSFNKEIYFSTSSLHFIKEPTDEVFGT